MLDEFHRKSSEEQALRAEGQRDRRTVKRRVLCEESYSGCVFTGDVLLRRFPPGH